MVPGQLSRQSASLLSQWSRVQVPHRVFRLPTETKTVCQYLPLLRHKKLTQNGSMVQRLAHNLYTVEMRVRFPLGLKSLQALKKLAPTCSHSVVVSTADFESAILGSSPGESLMSSHSKNRILSNPRRQHNPFPNSDSTIQNFALKLSWKQQPSDIVQLVRIEGFHPSGRGSSPRIGKMGAQPKKQLSDLTKLTPKASVAEWSKALDSSSSIYGCVGSNPTACNLCPIGAIGQRVRLLSPWRPKPLVAKVILRLGVRVPHRVKSQSLIGKNCLHTANLAF